jgi:hypothetical protein
MNKVNAPNKFQTCPRGREIEEGSNYLKKEGGPVGEVETPVLRELNPPMNSNIPWRNQEIANGGSWVNLIVKLEKGVVKSG